MANGNLVFTLWDVGHGLSIWIETPNGSNHWIDLGRTPNFSPSEYVYSDYGVRNIDYLIVSHPDRDHLEDLPEFRNMFGDPRCLHRNKSLPKADTFGQLQLNYQREYAGLCSRFNGSLAPAEDPANPTCNGGVQYIVRGLAHGESVSNAVSDGRAAIEGNNTSLVVMLLYAGVLFLCPGDIEPLGWRELWQRYEAVYRPLIRSANCRFLVAPHHGRKSGYCKEMMDAIRPHATFISDIWGNSETHPAFRSDPLGVLFSSGETIKYYTTKRAGRVRVAVSSKGLQRIHQID